MELKQLLLLLPCHSLEDFPTHYRDQDAQDLLLAWSTLWHPTLLHANGKMPAWNRCEQPPDDCQGHLVLIPQVATSRLPSGFLVRCEEQGGIPVATTGDRDQDSLTLLEQIGRDSERPDPAIVQEFYSLAYTYLQIQLLTRQLRYSSNLDEVHFEAQLLKAAAAVANGDADQRELALDRCYDVLSEERHRYYPMDSYLVDLTLLAETTLGKRLRGQLQSAEIHNYLVDQALLETLQKNDPDLFQLLQTRVKDETARLIGGGRTAAATGLVSYQSLMDQFEQSQHYFRQQFGKPLTIYARRTAGLEQTLPSILTWHGYHAALHQSFDEGKIHATTSTNFRWEGPDGQFLNSLTKTILDAQQPNVFLRLGIQIGEALDVDHLAVMQLVHWPDQVCPLYRDLAVSARRSNALGKWSTLEDVFTVVHEPGYGESIHSTDYRTEYLRDFRSQYPEDPLAGVRRMLKAEAEHRMSGNLAVMAQLAQGTRPDPVLEAYSQSRQAKGFRNRDNEDPGNGSTAVGEGNGATADRDHPMLAQRLIASLAQDGEGHLLLVNPASQPQRILLRPEELKGRTLESIPADQVYHVSRGMMGNWAVVDVPAMGYLHLPAGKMQVPGSDRSAGKKILVNQTTMRNEFLEATIDIDSGSLRSIHNYEKRGNLCSLQMAWFDTSLKKLVQESLKKESSSDWRANLVQLWKGNQDPREKALAMHQGGYTRMVAQSIKTLFNNSAVAEVRVQGTLNIRKKVVADFLIDYRLIRGSRFVDIRAQVTPRTQSQEIKLLKGRVYQYPPDEEKNSSGYRHYFGWRLAHSEASADRYRDLNSLRRRAPGGRFVAPYLVEWVGQNRLTWQCHGQPFHRVPADGKLDTVVGYGGSEILHSQVSIGLGPAHSQVQLEMQQMEVLRLPCGPLRQGMPAAAFLAQCTSRHVSLIDWNNCYDAGVWTGVRVRVLETNGKSRKFGLDLAVTPQSVTVEGNDPNYQPECTIDGNQVQAEIGAFELLELTIKC